MPGNPKILIVDDEPVILESIIDYLDDYPIEVFSDPQKALAALEKHYFDILVSDYRMPGLSGLDLFLESKRHESYYIGILLTAFADKKLLLEFINRNLVSRVIEKPLDLQRFKSAVDEAVLECRARDTRRAELENLRFWYEDLSHQSGSPGRRFIGFNGSLKHIYQDLRNIADTDENVILTGETGTGKELIARMIHRVSRRRNGPFVTINCGALPDNLIESELYGYAKGAFTGAFTEKEGKVELAHGGTLFLDEIGELKPDHQVKLLHVVQTKQTERLGANKIRKVDFRLVTATNRDLKTAIIEGDFREDLYYRVSTIPLHLPPLREREEDLEELVLYLIDRFVTEMRRKPVSIEAEALTRLKCYPWPGNIRELENVLKRAIILLGPDDTVITADTFGYLFDTGLPEEISPQKALEALSGRVIDGTLQIKNIERRVISAILSRFNGNIAEAVKHTSISKDKFYRSRR